MLQKNLLIMRNKSALNLKAAIKNSFHKEQKCCPACLASGNETEEHCLGLIRWE